MSNLNRPLSVSVILKVVFKRHVKLEVSQQEACQSAFLKSWEIMHVCTSLVPFLSLRTATTHIATHTLNAQMSLFLFSYVSLLPVFLKEFSIHLIPSPGFFHIEAGPFSSSMSKAFSFY